MFKRYECGCIGFVICDEAPPKRVYVVRPCDDDGGDLVNLIFRRRDALAMKTSRKLTPQEVVEILDELNVVVDEASKFRELLSLLR